MSANTPTWNSQAAITQAVRQRPPASATGAPSSTTRVTTAMGGSNHAWPTSRVPNGE
jgi:hypothetical protein